MLITLVAAALAAGSGNAAAQPAAQDASSDPNRLVCRNIRETGSRLVRRRICMTASEWTEQRRLMRQGIERLQATNRNRPAD